MLDRAGSIYGTIGGLVVGLAGGAWLAAIQETSRWATSLFGLIVYAVLVVIGLYLSIASLAGWKLPGRQSRVQILVDEVDTFVEQIHDWLEIRRDDGHLHRLGFEPYFGDPVISSRQEMSFCHDIPGRVLKLQYKGRAQ